MQKIARKKPEASKSDSLRLRVVELKKHFKANADYTTLYDYEFGTQSDKVKAKIRAVWNLVQVDEQITANLEAIAVKVELSKK